MEYILVGTVQESRTTINVIIPPEPIFYYPNPLFMTQTFLTFKCGPKISDEGKFNLNLLTFYYT